MSVPTSVPITVPMSVPITVSVVVPATDRPPTLPLCTAALARAADADEVVVVDGPRELSVCEARNAGARRARGDVLVFVDSDVEIHPDALTRIKAAFQADPGLTGVFGSYDDAPSRGGAVAAFRNLLHHHVHSGAAGPAETFWSGLGAVRRAEFLAAGGFDADRFPHPSVEDVELGSRLVAGGARLRLDPTIQGTHLKAWTLRGMVVTDFSRRGVPWVALLLRTGRSSTTLNLGWRHRLSALACVLAALAALGGRPRLAAGGLVALLGLNHDFYRLLARRRGWPEAALGVGLHAVHLLTAVASVPAGVLVHLRERWRQKHREARR
ncbi:MAG: glycosyltransferase [Pseudonocardia sp.]